MKDDDIQDNEFSIHNQQLIDAQNSENSQMLNELLTTTIFKAKKDLKELARLKKRELGPAYALYTQSMLMDHKDELYVCVELHLGICP